MLGKVKKTINEYCMLETGDKVLVAVSGGVDSLSLLHILLGLKEEYGITLAVAHIDHCTRRGQSHKDAEFVKTTCSDLGIKFHLKKVNVFRYANEHNISTELAGRRLRYGFFEELSKEYGYSKTAVAHNINDHVETIIMRFIRGSGLEGITGIKPMRAPGIIRPLIGVTRNEIEQYCSEIGIKPKEDSSNYQPIYTRNKIRLELLPLLQRNYNQNIIDTLNRNAYLLKEDNNYLEDVSSKFYDSICVIDDDIINLRIKDLLKLHKSMQRRVLRKALSYFYGDMNGIEYKHIYEILNLANSTTSGNTINLKGGIIASVSFDNLQIYEGHKNREQDDFEYKLNITQKNVIQETGGFIETRIISRQNIEELEANKYKALFDYDKLLENGIINEIYIRNRRPGDFFSPIGMKGRKKLKKHLIEKRIPYYSRDSIPLIAFGNEILWIIGFDRSKKYDVNNNDIKRILVLEYHKI